MSNKTNMGKLYSAIQGGSDEEIDGELELMSAGEIRDELKPFLSKRCDMDAWHDYAAAALTGLVLNPNIHLEDVPTHAADQADAMLHERAKRTEEQS